MTNIQPNRRIITLNVFQKTAANITIAHLLELSTNGSIHSGVDLVPVYSMSLCFANKWLLNDTYYKFQFSRDHNVQALDETSDANQ